MNNKEISILMVGVGGYGENYVDALLDEVKDYNFKIVGAVDPYPSIGAERLKSEKNVRFYENMDSFYQQNHADLCIISTPIHYHKQQVIYALKNGSHVLCEKPASCSAQDVEEMIAAQEETDRFAAIGFQFSFSEPILQFKKDIINGIWGKPILLKSISLLPRSENYFSDRSWAGKKYDNQGNCIMDSIANNAAAHALHNMLFVLGDEIDLSAMPISCDAKLIRANKIETFDGITAKFILENGVAAYFYAAHPVKKEVQHTFVFQFEKGIINWTFGGQVLGTLTNGVVKNYGVAGDFICKLKKTLQAVKNGKYKIPCQIKTVLPHAKAVDLINRYLSDVAIIQPSSLQKRIFENNQEGYYLPGLDEEMLQCYSENRLLGVEM